MNLNSASSFCQIGNRCTQKQYKTQTPGGSTSPHLVSSHPNHVRRARMGSTLVFNNTGSTLASISARKTGFWSPTRIPEQNSALNRYRKTRSSLATNRSALQSGRRFYPWQLVCTWASLTLTYIHAAWGGRLAGLRAKALSHIQEVSEIQGVSRPPHLVAVSRLWPKAAALARHFWTLPDDWVLRLLRVQPGQLVNRPEGRF